MNNIFCFRFVLTFILWNVFGFSLFAKQIIEIQPTNKDATPKIREAIEKISDSEVKFIFTKGTYHFFTTYAFNKYYSITNHNNGDRNVIFKLENLKSIEIEGNGSQFIFNGQVAPFIFENCKKVTLSNLSIDWDIPFSFQAELIDFNKKEGWRDLKPATDGFSWKLKGKHLKFPNINGFSYAEIGATYAFDPKTKDVVFKAKGLHTYPTNIEKRPNGILRFYEKLKYYPPKGSIMSSKGGGSEDRYAPGVYVKASSNITIDNVKVHHALGMGFLFERTTDIVLKNSGVHLSENSTRVVSSTADATHFCNCRGHILVENCRFENMLDDGTNVHGTYVFVDEVINDKTLRVGLKHQQQMGFIFAEIDDEIWFIHQPNVQRSSTQKVVDVKIINNQYAELTFAEKLPEATKKGDALENKTWNPTFTMRACKIGNHRARNIVLKSPLKTVIENNTFFSSDMASILFRGESLKWFESGAVKDVLIQNNYFSYCNHGSAKQSVLAISPKTGKTFNATEVYDQNIKFINNTIETFGNKIVFANRVKDLVIEGNTIKQTNTHQPILPRDPVFEFSNCENITLKNNSYSGKINVEKIKIDDFSKKSLTQKGNKGF